MDGVYVIFILVEHHLSFFFYFYILEELYLMVHTFIIQQWRKEKLEKKNQWYETHSFGYQILFYIFWILLPCQWYSYDIIINPQLMMSALLGFSVPPSVFCSLLCLALIRRHWKDTSFGSAALRDNHQPLGSKGKILYSSGLKVLHGCCWRICNWESITNECSCLWRCRLITASKRKRWSHFPKDSLKKWRES